MKIQYGSDLHLEFKANSQYLMDNPIPAIGDYLLLAGDITYFNEEYFKHEFFDDISEKFKEVFIVPGNHEYYNGFDVSLHEKGLYHSIRKNVHFVNNTTKKIDGVDFIFTTLWSRLDRMFIPFIVNGMNDFYQIIRKGERLTATAYNRLHEISLAFLYDALRDSKAKKKVVVTHHVPTHLCNPEQYVGSTLNSAFVNSLGELIETNNIDYWIYGHHHNNLRPVELGKTKIITNQLGYINQGENEGFDLEAWFEV